MEAVILAGGYGTRLKSAVPDLPKSMAPVHGKPFLSLLLDTLSAQGFSRVILAVFYQHEYIQDYFKNQYKNLSITYSIDAEALQTGGAIKHALSYTHEENVFVMNGDTLVRVDYSKMSAFHQDATLTMALHKTNQPSRYGQVSIQGDHVISFAEKKEAQSPSLINAGVYLLKPSRCLPLMSSKIFSFEQHFLEPYISVLKPKAFITEDYFIDIGTPQDYEKFKADIKGGLLHVS